MTDAGSLENLALRISDGDEVEWPEDGQNAGLLANLRVVEKLARTLRDLDTDSAIEPPETWGRLIIREKIGGGAYADVFRAFDPMLEREVALKLFRDMGPDRQARMLTEGRLMARVRHPNVITVHGADEHDERVGLWMELAAGNTLDQLVDQDHTLSAEEATTIALQLCSALARVHANGLIHGDVKAQNVIRDSAGEILLADFGSGADLRNVDSIGRISGTPLYFAPEVLAGDGATPRSDIYSLGVLLFYLVTGRFPVQATSVEDLRQAHAEHAVASLRDLRPELPERFIAAVETALATDPESRFRTMGAFAKALSGVGFREIEFARRRLLATATVIAIIALLAWWQPLSPIATYQLDTTLYRVVAGNELQPLPSGASVAVGDRLLLELTASTDLHVFVVNQDSHGQAYGLFPLPEIEALNPLTAGVTHRLPKSTPRLTYTWQVDSAGGTERIHVVAGRSAPGQISGAYGQLPPAEPAGTDRMQGRGIGTVLAMPRAGGGSAEAFLQHVRAATGKADDVAGISHRIIELQNP